MQRNFRAHVNTSRTYSNRFRKYGSAHEEQRPTITDDPGYEYRRLFVLEGQITRLI